jgi:vacuolar-type H+-ATPase subunit H
MPTLGPVDANAPSYPGGSERLPSVRQYAPQTPSLSGDNQAFSQALDQESAAQETVISQAQTELTGALDEASQQGRQELEQISRGPMREAQASVEQGRAEVQGQAQAQGERAQAELEQILQQGAQGPRRRSRRAARRRCRATSWGEPRLRCCRRWSLTRRPSLRP